MIKIRTDEQKKARIQHQRKYRDKKRERLGEDAYLAEKARYERERYKRTKVMGRYKRTKVMGKPRVKSMNYGAVRKRIQRERTALKKREAELATMARINATDNNTVEVNINNRNESATTHTVVVAASSSSTAPNNTADGASNIPPEVSVVNTVGTVATLSSSSPAKKKREKSSTKKKRKKSSDSTPTNKDDESSVVADPSNIPPASIVPRKSSRIRRAASNLSTHNNSTTSTDSSSNKNDKSTTKNKKIKLRDPVAVGLPLDFVSSNVDEVEEGSRIKVWYSHVRNRGFYEAIVEEINGGVKDPHYIVFNDNTDLNLDLSEQFFEIIPPGLVIEEDAPNLKSFLISKESFQNRSGKYKIAKKRLHNNVMRFVKGQINNNFEKNLYIMIPFSSLKNKPRWSHQSPQALRIFFGKEVDSERNRKGKSIRYAYGPRAVNDSTGMHPKDYHVHPFDDLIDDIITDLVFVLRYELGKDFEDFQFEFNFLEIKMYLGKQIFKDDNNLVILDQDKKKLNWKCNNSVGYHRDLIFRDNGEQRRSDTARPDHPIVTYNVGCTRKLRFKWWIKKPGEKWEVAPTKPIEKEMDHGSIMVLLPADERPTNCNGDLFHTKHSGLFKEEGMSIGLVLRSLNGNAIAEFNSDDNTISNCDMNSNILQHFEKWENRNQKQYNAYEKQNKNNKFGMKQVIKNIQKLSNTFQ